MSGDFNINLLWSERQLPWELSSPLVSYEVLNVMTDPTPTAQNSFTLLDLFFTNAGETCVRLMQSCLILMIAFPYFSSILKMFPHTASEKSQVEHQQITHPALETLRSQVLTCYWDVVSVVADAAYHIPVSKLKILDKKRFPYAECQERYANFGIPRKPYTKSR